MQRIKEKREPFINVPKQFTRLKPRMLDDPLAFSRQPPKSLASPGQPPEPKTSSTGGKRKMRKTKSKNQKNIQNQRKQENQKNRRKQRNNTEQIYMNLHT
jgi:hypothetical protein